MELVLPQNYVEIEQEEMMYLDGGFYISNYTLTRSLMAVGLNPIGFTLAGLGVYAISKKVSAKVAALAGKIGLSFGGPVGGIISFIAGGSLALTFSSAVANAIIQGKGIEVDWRRAFGTIPYWVDINVK